MLFRCAVIGKPIAHSWSPFIHQRFAEQVKLALRYEKILGSDLDFEQQVRAFFAHQGRGLNVTLPFKQRAFHLAAKASAACIKAGAANTLWLEAGELWADNTDGLGLVRDLERHLSLAECRILILGAGGAARGIIHPLLDCLPACLVVANRSRPPLTQLAADIPSIQCVELAELSGEFDLIINATSAGVAAEPLVLPRQLMLNRPFCYDLTYQQQGATPFVLYAQQHGAQAVDGLGMLVEQAAESFVLWHGQRPEPLEVLAELRRLQAKNCSI